MPTIAVLGTGTMGAPMARNLVEAGHDVRVYNRTRDRAEGLGGTVCDDPAAAVDGAEFVITMLADAEAVEALADAVLASGAIWIQMSTIGAAATDALIARAAEHDATFVDAPVSGTKQPAEDGTLVVLAGGSDDALDACAPIFDVLGAKTVRTGPAGSANRMKLVVNTWLLALVEGLAESVALAEGLGVDPAAFLDVIDGGPLFAPYAKLKGNAMIERSFDPSFSLGLAAKDAGLVHEAAQAAGLELPLVQAVAEQMARGVDAGHGEKDMSATVETARG